MSDEGLDVMVDIVTSALVALVAVLTLFLVNETAKLVLKRTAHSESGCLRVLYRFRTYRVECPALYGSPYFDRFPSSKRYIYEGTLDDPVLAELAGCIMEATRGRSERWRAGFILALVQQNVTYRSDSDTYGVSERYAFPVCALYLRAGDCEDSAYLGCALSRLCGIQSAIVRVDGHVAYGCFVRSIGYTFVHCGMTYIWCESTSVLPMGWYLGNRDIMGTYDLLNPPSGYIENGTFVDSFAKYKY